MHNDRETPVKYILLIHQGDALARQAELSADEQHQVAGEYWAINETPGVTPGQWMQPPDTATTVRVDGTTTLTTDGPFVEIKEALGGYLIYEAPDLDAAIALAARIPAARFGGAVEVRPLVAHA
jgi:hypothetical protein